MPFGNALREDFDIAGTFELPDKRYELNTLILCNGEASSILKTGKEAEAKEFP